MDATIVRFWRSSFAYWHRLQGKLIIIFLLLLLLPIVLVGLLAFRNGKQALEYSISEQLAGSSRRIASPSG